MRFIIMHKTNALGVGRDPEPGVDRACGNAARRAGEGGYPRPMNGIFVAITVMNCTFASSGRLAM
jgi:hypothetical protein